MNRFELDITQDLMRSLGGGKNVIVFEKHHLTNEWQKFKGKFYFPYKKGLEFNSLSPYIINPEDHFENIMYGDIDISIPSNSKKHSRKIVITDRQYKPKDIESYEIVWCIPEDKDFIKKMEELMNVNHS